jgi:peptidyl-prolyl cis-trans isomerase A (cyclophilin A)
MALNPDTPAPPIEKLVPGTGELRAIFKTSMGDITVKLYEKEAPRTVANFVALATGQIEWTDPKTGQKTKKPLYSGTVFHRVIPDFMIQGGDPMGTGTGGPGWRFGDEIHPKLRHDKPGALSMANAGPNTNGSQFFLCEVATPWLDGKHAVFGQTIQNVELIAKITHSPRDGRDRPKTPITLDEIQIVRA